MTPRVRSRPKMRRVVVRRDLHALVRDAVREEMRRLIGDPDYGRALRIGVAARLARSQRAKRGGKVRDAHKVIARLGLRV